MTSNLELEKIAKCLNITNFYCIMKDKLKDVNILNFPLNRLSVNTASLNLIINLENSDQNGSHWVLAYVDNNQKLYYSSFGDPISIEVKNFLYKIDDRPILTSDIQIQDFNESTCGLLCILILYLLNCGQKFEEIILSFNDSR